MPVQSAMFEIEKHLKLIYSIFIVTENFNNGGER